MSETVTLALVGVLSALATYAVPKIIEGFNSRRAIRDGADVQLSLATVQNAEKLHVWLMNQFDRVTKERDALVAENADHEARIQSVERDRDEERQLAVSLRETLDRAKRVIAEARVEIVRLETLLRSHGIDPKSEPKPRVQT